MLNSWFGISLYPVILTPMTTTKKIIITVVALAVFGTGYWLTSPLFYDAEVNSNEINQKTSSGSTSSPAVDTNRCDGILFSLDSKYIIDEDSGEIYSNTVERPERVGNISLEQNERVVDVSDHILITSQGRIYYFKDSPASNLIRLNIEGVGEKGSRQTISQTGEIAAVSKMSPAATPQPAASTNGGIIDVERPRSYKFSLLYKDGTIKLISFNVGYANPVSFLIGKFVPFVNNNVNDFDVLDPTNIEIPTSETPISFKGWGNPYAGDVQIVTNLGVLVGNRSLDSDEGYKRTTEQTYRFEQPLDIMDRVYEGRTEFLYTTDGVKYKGSTKDHSYTQAGNLPKSICSLGR
jgi:hypothetical protein